MSTQERNPREDPPKYSDALTLFQPEYNGSLILGFQPWGIIMNIACSSVKSIMKMLIDSGHKLGLTNIIQ